MISRALAAWSPSSLHRTSDFPALNGAQLHERQLLNAYIVDASIALVYILERSTARIRAAKWACSAPLTPLASLVSYIKSTSDFLPDLHQEHSSQNFFHRHFLQDTLCK